MIIAFTGHRPDKLGGYDDNPTTRFLRGALANKLVELKSKHPDIRAICGMALGFDQLAGWGCVLVGIPFTAAVPCADQESTWPAASQEAYRQLLARAERVHVVNEGAYAAWKMQARNEWMVSQADLVIACWDGSPGGTGNCVAYAKRCGKPVENIWRGRIL